MERERPRPAIKKFSLLIFWLTLTGTYYRPLQSVIRIRNVKREETERETVGVVFMNEWRDRGRERKAGQA